MKTNRSLEAKALVNQKVGCATPCAPQFRNFLERGCVVLDQPQHAVQFRRPRFFHALRLVFDTAALLSAVLTTSLLLLYPASAHAQGGVPLWTNRYNGGPATFDEPRAIAVDRSGNVFVTGLSSDRYVTIKYSNAGLPLWVNRYHGTGNGGAAAIAVDSSGNIFVTGYYGTVAYSGEGAPLWTNLYSGSAIAVDSRGNVFMTYGGGTVACSGAGLVLWTNLYGGRAIALDSNSNVFVTESGLTIKYSDLGVPVWTNLSNLSGANPSRIALDSSGNLFVTGGSSAGNGFNDYATIKYSNSGIPLWTNRYNGLGNSEDSATAIALDSAGNVFVTGYSVGGDGHRDYATIKYSTAGVPLWTRRYSASANSDDTAFDIAVDSSGNVFVTGGSSSDAGSIGITLAYSNAGSPLWTNRFDAGLAIAIDGDGNLFGTGSGSIGMGTGVDIVTIKYSSSIVLPRLAIQKLNNGLMLSWTNAGFNLQTAPAVTGPFTNLPAATSPYTNPLTAPQQFFRLKSD